MGGIRPPPEPTDVTRCHAKDLSDWQPNDAVVEFSDLLRRGRSVRCVPWFQRDVHNTSAALYSVCSWGRTSLAPFFGKDVPMSFSLASGARLAPHNYSPRKLNV